MPTHKPVTINGVTYPSCEHAGRALGLNGARVRRARRSGNYENLFINDDRGIKKPTTVDGVTYESMAAAARAVGCSEKCFYDPPPRKRKT